MRTQVRTLTTNNKRPINKLVLGFVGLAATTVIGTAGVAAAQPTRDPNAPNPPSKAACANYAQYGFKNHGQCVSWWETHNNPGHGYGGNGNNNHVNANVDVAVNGNNNVVTVILKFLFG